MPPSTCYGVTRTFCSTAPDERGSLTVGTVPDTDN